MKSVYSCAFKPERLDLSCKANKCRDAGTVDLGELTTHETLPCFDLGDAGSRQDKKNFMSVDPHWITNGILIHYMCIFFIY